VLEWNSVNYGCVMLGFKDQGWIRVLGLGLGSRLPS
jgi:hypothetical protein